MFPTTLPVRSVEPALTRTAALPPRPATAIPGPRGLPLFAPDHARQVLAGTRGHTKQLALYREIAAALGDGLLTSDGDDWQRQRRSIQPLFTHQRITGYATVMAEEVTHLLQGWQAVAASGRPMDLHRQMTGYTMRVLGRLLFGRARRSLDRVVDRILQQRRGGRAPGGDDLLGRLLAARDPDGGAGLDDAEIRAQLLLFLLAGHETTASALTFTLHLLGRHPDAQQRVRDEVQRVVGGSAPPPRTRRSLPTPPGWSRRPCGCTRRPTPSAGGPARTR